MTARDKTYAWKRWSRQNDSHRITIVTQHNSWKSNIFHPDSIYFEEEKIKRASSGTHFVSKIWTLTMVIRWGWRNRKIFRLVNLRWRKPGAVISYFGHASLFLTDFVACVASVSSRGSSRKLGFFASALTFAFRAITRLETLVTQATDFDAFVWRLPKGTQAKSQVCFTWMSKCVKKRGPGKFGAIPKEEKCRRKQLLN